jgi:hypothetical protein
VTKSEKKRYTTYLFPSHLAAIEKIARVSNKSAAQVITEALDTYLTEVGALDKPATVPPSKGDIAQRLSDSSPNKG